MIKGTYIVYEDGKEICRQSNVITKFGKRFLTNYMSGTNASTKRDIALGIHRNEVLVTDASASAGIVTYTGKNYYAAGDIVSIYGLSTTAFNLTEVQVLSATSTEFSITNAATGTAVTGSTSGRAFKKATANDTRLGFEFYRVPVVLASSDIQTSSLSSSYAVVYKATIPQDVSGTVSEIGLYPTSKASVAAFDGKFLADFYDALDWIDGSGYNAASSPTGSKIGSSVLNFVSGSGTAKEYTSNVDLDLSGYSLADTVTLAYYKKDDHLSKIRIKLYHTDDAWFYHDITPQSDAGYKITPDILLSDLLNNSGGTGTPDAGRIIKIGIEITPTSGQTTTVGMDGLRINDEDTFDPIFGLISRTTLATPLEKVSGRQVDIEYRLDLGF